MSLRVATSTLLGQGHFTHLLVILLKYNATANPFYNVGLKVHIINYTKATTCLADSHLGN